MKTPEIDTFLTTRRTWPESYATYNSGTQVSKTETSKKKKESSRRNEVKNLLSWVENGEVVTVF